jgi:hypothetical protein
VEKGPSTGRPLGNDGGKGPVVCGGRVLALVNADTRVLRCDEVQSSSGLSVSFGQRMSPASLERC